MSCRSQGYSLTQRYTISISRKLFRTSTTAYIVLDSCNGLLVLVALQQFLSFIKLKDKRRILLMVMNECSDDFTAYAEVCFRSFGDRVKHWTTLNEPNIDPVGGFDLDFLQPRRCSFPFGDDCTNGGRRSCTSPVTIFS